MFGEAMKDIRDWLSIFGPLGVIGILLIVFASIVLIGVNPLNLKGLGAELKPSQWVGLAFLISGLVLLIWRITQRKDETTISDADAKLLREEILPPLNRQAILQYDHQNEDLRCQFSGIVSARIEIQKRQNRIVSTSLKSILTVIINLLKEIEDYSLWGQETDVKPDRNEVWRHQSEFNEFCEERRRNGLKTPNECNGTYYGPMLLLIQEKLRPVRIIKNELNQLSSSQKSPPAP
jgi:hypothetical protein